MHACYHHKVYFDNYNDIMEIEIARSAYRHGIHDEDMLHAFRNAIRVVRLDDVSVLVGGDRSGRLLEVGVVLKGERYRIIHAMLARPRYLR